jgi:hypothetical protein
MRGYLLFMRMGYLLSLYLQLMHGKFKVVRLNWDIALLKLAIRCLEWLRRKIK